MIAAYEFKKRVTNATDVIFPTHDLSSHGSREPLHQDDQKDPKICMSEHTEKCQRDPEISLSKNTEGTASNLDSLIDRGDVLRPAKILQKKL